ncbi:unnamed protein product [Prorocentrum cordatum]|uniref:CobW C-terminal domain-containing protein n=1 Tax=Prorocentrum cordatum TaxID=2364126 RepID=A0ABN9V2B9_9DINO|nr:unnamed protein product [Polarella glacialis]
MAGESWDTVKARAKGLKSDIDTKMQELGRLNKRLGSTSSESPGDRVHGLEGQIQLVVSLREEVERGLTNLEAASEAMGRAAATSAQAAQAARFRETQQEMKRDFKRVAESIEHQYQPGLLPRGRGGIGKSLDEIIGQASATHQMLQGQRKTLTEANSKVGTISSLFPGLNGLIDKISDRQNKINFSAHAERNFVFAPPAPRPLPVVVVTGFLGSGKTTLVEKLYSSRANLRIATIAHDLAPSLNVDAELLATVGSGALRRTEAAVGDGDVLGLGGCVCCPDFDEALRRAVKCSLKEGVDEGSLDYLVLETSGASDPRRLVAMLEKRFGPCTRARLDHVVTVVDAERAADAGEGWLAVPGRADPESQLQLAQLLAADIILLNKADLVDGVALNTVEARLRELFPDARLFSCQYGRVPISDLLEVFVSSADAAAVSHEAVLAQATLSVPQCMEPLRRSISDTQQASASLAPLGGGHAVGHKVVEWSSRESRGVSLARLQQFLLSDLPRWQRSLRRGKGFLHVQEDSDVRWEWQMSGRLRYCIRRHPRESCAPLLRSFLVLIRWPRFPNAELAKARAALEALEEPPPEHGEAAQAEQAEVALAAAAAEVREACAPLGMEELAAPERTSAHSGHALRGASVVRFRLTGRAHFGIPEDVDLAASPYCIDLDAMWELARLVSASKGAPFLACGAARDPRRGGAPALALLWAAGAPGALASPAGAPAPPPPPPHLGTVLAVVRAEAPALLKRTFGHVTSCLCGQ